MLRYPDGKREQISLPEQAKLLVSVVNWHSLFEYRRAANGEFIFLWWHQWHWWKKCLYLWNKMRLYNLVCKTPGRNWPCFRLMFSSLLFYMKALNRKKKKKVTLDPPSALWKPSVSSEVDMEFWGWNKFWGTLTVGNCFALSGFHSYFVIAVISIIFLK